MNGTRLDNGSSEPKPSHLRRSSTEHHSHSSGRPASPSDRHSGVSRTPDVRSHWSATTESATSPGSPQSVRFPEPARFSLASQAPGDAADRDAYSPQDSQGAPSHEDGPNGYPESSATGDSHARPDTTVLTSAFPPSASHPSTGHGSTSGLPAVTELSAPMPHMPLASASTDPSPAQALDELGSNAHQTSRLPLHEEPGAEFGTGPSAEITVADNEGRVERRRRIRPSRHPTPREGGTRPTRKDDESRSCDGCCTVS